MLLEFLVTAVVQDEGSTLIALNPNFTKPNHDLEALQSSSPTLRLRCLHSLVYLRPSTNPHETCPAQILVVTQTFELHIQQRLGKKLLFYLVRCKIFFCSDNVAGTTYI